MIAKPSLSTVAHRICEPLKSPRINPGRTTMNGIDSRDRGPGVISSGEFPSQARSSFVHNAIFRSLSHGDVTCHRPWTFPFVSQDLKSSQGTPIVTMELPDKMYPTNICTAKWPNIRPQRYTALSQNHSVPDTNKYLPHRQDTRCLLAVFSTSVQIS